MDAFFFFFLYNVKFELVDALAREGVSRESFYLMIALLYLDVITQFGFSFLVSCLWVPACQYIPLVLLSF